MGKDDLQGRLDALVGQPVGSADRRPGPYLVNEAMIGHWAAAFEDANPVYTDPEAAARSVFGEIVAPPVMLQTWTFPDPIITGMAERGGSPVESTGANPLDVLDEAGFIATLASNSEFKIERYLHVGERVHAQTVMEAITEQKRTRIGPGHFVTWLTTYSVDDGEVVGRQRFRILKFRPEQA
ncbi:hypothetical protein BH10ACT1_BH10ACT1_18600 [soil metagenome]